jgi:hypothetical protein
MRPHHGWWVLALTAITPTALYAQASQPTSQPASQPASDDLAAEFAAELAGDSASQPAPPAPTGGPARLRFLPDISFNTSIAAAVFPNGSSDPDLRAHDPADSGFTLQEIELAATSIVDPFFRADLFAAIGLDEIEIEEAYLTSLGRLPLGLQLRAGQFFTRFGRQNPTHLHLWAFIDLPLTSRRMFGGDGLRDLGVEASARLPTDFIGTRGEFGPPLLTSELTISAQQGSNEVSFGEKDFGAPQGEVGGFARYLYAARLSNFLDLSDTSGLTLGLSYALSTNDTAGEGATKENRTALYGLDVFYRYKPEQGRGSFNLTAEYIQREGQIPGALIREGAAYIQGVARVTRAWELALRLDTVGLPGKVIGDGAALEIEGDPSQRFLPRVEYRASAAVSYYTSEFFRLRLQGGLDSSDTDGDAITDALFPEILLQANFSIGPHGAHPY